MFSRLAGFAAFGFVTVALATNVVLEAGSPPSSDATPADVAAYFSGHAAAVEYCVAFTTLAWLLMCVFGAGAAVAISRIERDRGEAWSTVGLIGIAMMTAMFGAVAAIRLTLAAGPPAGDATTGGLWHLHNAFFTLNNMAVVFILTGFSIGGVRTATLRRWHASVGLVSAGLVFVGVVVGSVNLDGGRAGISLVGFVGWLVWLVWLGTFGAVLLRRKATQGRGPARPGFPARSSQSEVQPI